MSFIYNMSDLWNNGATTYTSIKMNVTDTASASGSLLLDLQVGGSSKFSVSKAGVANVQDVFAASGVYAPTVIQITSSAGRFDIGGDVYLTRAAAASLRLGAADAAAPVAQTFGVQSVIAGTTNTAGTNFTIKGSAGTGTGAGGSLIFQVAPAGSSGSAQNAFVNALTINSTRAAVFDGTIAFQDVNGTIINGQGVSIATGWVAWRNGVGTSTDLYLYRDAANTLALRNGTNAQRFNIYGTYTDASNFERFSVYYSSGDAYYLAFDKLGTGVNRNLKILTGADLYLQIGGGSYYWYYTASGGHMLAGADNTYNIGASGANRPANVYAATAVEAGVYMKATDFYTTGVFTLADGVTAPSAVAGRAKIYVDSADGDLKIIFGDGTVKTIVTDT
jgi:hypothetical protein